MIENLPPLINLCFVLIAASTIALYLYAVSLEPQGRVKLHASVLILICVVHSYLSLTGFYLIASAPPRFFLTLFPSTLVLLILIFWLGPNRVSTQTLRVLTLLSVIRVPIEMVLMWLSKEGHVPQLMTFDGRNFDILSGLSAPVVALMGFRRGKINRPLLIVWNVFALGLLLNIVTNGVLSLETPFQQFAFNEPNRGLLYFPFILLSAVIVPIVFATHVVSLWKLAFIPQRSTQNGLLESARSASR